MYEEMLSNANKMLTKNERDYTKSYNDISRLYTIDGLDAAKDAFENIGRALPDAKTTTALVLGAGLAIGVGVLSGGLSSIDGLEALLI
ncbi:hypothetical protein CWO85_01155 [Candidatus Phytoplasma ziziphi]|uniref:Uncharacterized protein n=1 Tax=Ziziphus jujuba witches'-broom phytoplasma TaxID=135727 RepID=A0A660HM69_ZIZJU|nr:hypothetical protein [Candidatus Phytoplasma ziziphi]AYJ01141.1 hypothetical protein CWO85_01155 [Candidatus Phytoplasma ziziphi]